MGILCNLLKEKNKYKIFKEDVLEAYTSLKVGQLRENCPQIIKETALRAIEVCSDANTIKVERDLFDKVVNRIYNSHKKHIKEVL